MKTLDKYRRMIDQVCIGYSGNHHWEFFNVVLQNTHIRNICVLGVYYGRDIAYMVSILESLNRNDYKIVGVDKFEDSAGEDWPDQLKNLTWQQAGFGAAPDIQSTRANLCKLGLDTNVYLYTDLAQKFLSNTEELFDFIYIDVSHDYQTTVEIINLAIDRIKPSGLIGGDDFSDQNNWGVASAVRESFVEFEIFANWIWLTTPSNYQERSKYKISSTNEVENNTYSKNFYYKNILVNLLEVYAEEGYQVRVGLNPWRESNRDASFAALYHSNNSNQELQILSTGGGISIDEIYFFENLLREFNPKKVFSVGIASGWSTIAFGLICPNAKLYGIDNLSEGYQAEVGLELTHKIARKLNFNLITSIGSSPNDIPSFMESIEGHIDFAFIDGLHTNEQIFLDFEAILPYLADTAIVAFHDVLNWNILEGWEQVKQLGLEHSFQNEILHRTASGIGILGRNINEDILSTIWAFYQDSQLL